MSYDNSNNIIQRINAGVYTPLNFSLITSGITNISTDKNNGNLYIVTKLNGIRKSIHPDQIEKSLIDLNCVDYQVAGSNYLAISENIVNNIVTGTVNFNNNLFNVDDKPVSCFISIDGKYGYVTLQNGKVYRTVDQGINWILINDISTISTISTISGNFNGSTLIVYSDSGLIYKSNDYGITWTNQLTIEKNQLSKNIITNQLISSVNQILDKSLMSFFDNDNAIFLFENRLYISKNATSTSVNWKQILSLSWTTSCNEIHYIDSGVILLIGKGFVMRTDDYGVTWKYIFSDKKEYKTIIIKNSTIELFTLDGECMVSNDNGLTFTYLQDEKIGNIIKIKFVSSTYFLLIDDDSGCIYKSSTDLKTFTTIATADKKYDDFFITTSGTYFFNSSSVDKLNTNTLTPTFDSVFIANVNSSGVVTNQIGGGFIYDVSSNTNFGFWTKDGLLYTVDNITPTQVIDIGSSSKLLGFFSLSGKFYQLILDENSTTNLYRSDSLDTGYALFSKFLSMNIISGFYGDIAISGTGQHQAVSSMYPGILSLSHNFGRSWNFVNLNEQLQILGLSMSEDGKDIVISTNDNISLSQNYGVDWNVIYTSESDTDIFQFLKIFENKIYCLTTNGKFIISYDFGVTWSNLNLILIGDNVSFNQLIVTLKSIITIESNGKIYMSKDNGLTWQIVYTIESNQLLFGSASYNGKYITFPLSTLSSPFDFFQTSNTVVLQSCDYGKTFSKNTKLNSNGFCISSVLSKSGKYQVITSNRQVFVSTDYGFSFRSYESLMSGINIRCVMSSDASMIKTMNLISEIYENNNDESYDISETITKDIILPDGEDDFPNMLNINCDYSDLITINLPKISNLYPSRRREYILYDSDNTWHNNCIKLIASDTDVIIYGGDYFDKDTQLLLPINIDTTRSLRLISNGINKWLLF